jgi:hypothetical protein
LPTSSLGLVGGRCSALGRLVVMRSGLHGCALAPLVALFLWGVLGAFLPCLVLGGVVVARWLFVAFFVRVVCVVRVCVVAFRVAFDSIAPVLALFWLVLGSVVLVIGQKQKRSKMGVLGRCFVVLVFLGFFKREKTKKRGKIPRFFIYSL